MNLRRVFGPIAVAVGLLGVACVISACGDDSAEPTTGAPEGRVESRLPQGSEPSNLNPDELTTEIDNPYLPFKPGSKWVYRETDGEEEVKVVVSVTGDTKEIANGATARVVRDTATDSKTGELLEVTDDWYAQDAEGNVWYLGEDTKEYENGEVKTTAGSFEAGVDGADAGVVMPANPQVGMSYRQEYYAGEAEDKAEVLSLDEQAEAPFGHYTDVLMTRDLVPIEPKVNEHKFYAPGVGLVLAMDISGGAAREELVSYREGS